MKRFLFFVASIFAASGFYAEDKWLNFKETYNKTYNNVVEEKVRYGIFLNNLKLIEEHNARYDVSLEMYWMGINKFGDLTSEEFEKQLGLQNKLPEIQRSVHHSTLATPDVIDWRKTGAVLEVKDQGLCRSSWAFSATGAMEGQNAILYNRRESLSEQQLLDCSGRYGNGNCEETGDTFLAYKYVIDDGIQGDSIYPYTAKQGLCHAVPGQSLLKIKSYNIIPANESALKNAVGTVGPISVAIFASLLQFYEGGIFNSADCQNNVSYLNHAALVVGYGTTPTDYWIIKNSWGRLWGEKGYFKLARNVNRCGIALDAMYPVW